MVSRDSVRIALNISELNYLNIILHNIQNTYLTSNLLENIWTVSGPVFGSDQGEVMRVVRVLYGKKFSGLYLGDILA